MTDSLSIKQRQALDAVLLAEPGATISQVAEDAGINRDTLSRYLKDPTFISELQKVTSRYAQFARPRIVRSLIDSAERPGHVASKRLFFNIMGDLKNNLSITADVNVDTQPIPIDSLPFAIKLLLIHVLEGNTLSNKLQAMILSELQTLDITVNNDDTSNTSNTNSNTLALDAPPITPTLETLFPFATIINPFDYDKGITL